MVKEFLLGDNPFIGVSHLAQEKGRQEVKEAVLERKVEVVRKALEGGATGFTFSTHPANLKLLRYLRDNHKDVVHRLNYYILVPYAAMYIREANIQGSLGLVKRLFKNIAKVDPIESVSMLLTANLNKAITLFLKYELKPYLKILPQHKIKAVLLHEIITEPAVAFELNDLIEETRKYVEREIGVAFGLETRNIGHLRRYLTKNHIRVDYIMTPLNPLGYQMSPSKDIAEKAIKQLGFRGMKIIAINILASGAISLDEAMRYLIKFKNTIFAVTSASIRPDRILSNFKKLSRIYCISNCHDADSKS